MLQVAFNYNIAMLDKAIAQDSTLRIRHARGTDSPAMISMINSAFNVEDFLEGTRTDEARLSELMEKGVFLVAENGRGEIVASVYLEILGERAYFRMLAVDPSQQGGGLGKKMIQTAEERARKCGCAYMDIKVLSLRSELLPFYAKLGYAQTGTEPFRPSRPLKPGVECCAIVMSKKLRPVPGQPVSGSKARATSFDRRGSTRAEALVVPV